MSATKSIIETALEDLTTQLKTISIANGYRNDVAQVSNNIKGISQITSFPEIQVVFFNGTVHAMSNDKQSVFAEHVRVLVYGYCTANVSSADGTNDLTKVAESFIHDIKRCLKVFIVLNLNTAGKKYQIEAGMGAYPQEMFLIERELPISTTMANKGFFCISFQIHILSEDGDF